MVTPKTRHYSTRIERESCMKAIVNVSGFLLLILSLLAPFSYAQDDENPTVGLDPDLLIFSTTHPPFMYTKQATGILKIDIVSFNPIQTVDLNGEPVAVSDDRHVKTEIPYDLSTFPDQKVTFTITARTEAGSAQNSFTINLGSKPRKSPLQIVGILSLTSNDNVNSESEDLDKDSDVKAVLTVVPKYSFSIRENSTLDVKGIFLREKYAESENKAKEISYTQLAVGWVEKKTPLGEFSVDLGANDIRLENANLFAGEQETSTEAFMKGNMEQELTEKTKWHIGMQFKVKDAENTPANINYESDANVYSLFGGLKDPLLLLASNQKSLKSALKAGIELNDAKGKYMDSTSYQLGGKFGYVIDKWTPEIKLKTRLKTMAIEDPLKDNKVPSYLTTTLTTKLKYKLLKKTMAALELKHKNVASNIAASTIKQNLITLSITQVF